MKKISEKIIRRLIIYRKLLIYLKYNGVSNIFSHKLAALVGSTPQQVRSDLMVIGYNGTPVRGYDIDELEKSISKFLDNPKGQRIAILGLGRLGLSIMQYCYWQSNNLALIIAFDNDPDKVNKTFQSCQCYHIDDLEKLVIANDIEVGILTLPTEYTQTAADRLVASGIKGILNYSPIRLQVPDNVTLEDMDMMLAIERVEYYAKIQSRKH
jgi:redox-sensing transcriptional repressor